LEEKSFFLNVLFSYQAAGYFLQLFAVVQSLEDFFLCVLETESRNFPPLALVIIHYGEEKQEQDEDEEKQLT
jgi:hypothetical protein